MPRRFFKRITPHHETLHTRWYLRMFGQRLRDPRLWTLQRRAVTAAFAAGLAICFVPLPIHLPLAVLVAILFRINIPAILVALLPVNPITAVPIYYVAYRVGAAVLGLEPHTFRFRLDWDWLQYGLGPMWKPFLLGCLICAVVAAAIGWTVLELIWRWSVTNRYRTRKASSTG